MIRILLWKLWKCNRTLRCFRKNYYRPSADGLGWKRIISIWHQRHVMYCSTKLHNHFSCYSYSLVFQSTVEELTWDETFLRFHFSRSHLFWTFEGFLPIFHCLCTFGAKVLRFMPSAGSLCAVLQQMIAVNDCLYHFYYFLWSSSCQTFTTKQYATLLDCNLSQQRGRGDLHASCWNCFEMVQFEYLNEKSKQKLQFVRWFLCSVMKVFESTAACRSQCHHLFVEISVSKAFTTYVLDLCYADIQSLLFFHLLANSVLI